jgi:hypothetical protein
MFFRIIKRTTYEGRGVEAIAENIVESLPVVDEATKAIYKRKNYSGT